MKKLICFLFGLLLCFTCFAQSFEIYCASVGEDGAVSISFEQQTNSDFLEYRVSKWDNATASFVNCGVVADVSQAVYTDNTQQTANGSVRYRIEAVYSSGQIFQDEITTIFLTAVQNPNNIVNLSWNDLRDANNASDMQRQYSVYRKRKSTDTDWSLIANTSTSNYIDTLPQICYDTICYIVELEDESGCENRSNQVQILVGDMEIPNSPILQSSTVELDSQVLNLEWIPSDSDDVFGYVVCGGSPCIAIDTIWGADASNYECDECDIEQLNSLAVMAFDSCFNTSLRTETHTNMVLTYNNVHCSDKISLAWNSYDDFDSGIRHYNIYSKKENANAYTLERTTQNNSEQIQIDITESSYWFYIEAVSNDGVTAKSNRIEVEVSNARQVEFIEIRKVSVRENNTDIDLEFYVDASLAVNFYRLQRAVDGGAYSLIANLPYTGNNTLTYIDHLPSSALEHSYSYILSAPDECGLSFKQSKSVSPMQMTLKSTDATSNMLTWTPYSGWENGVGFYEIYRYSQGETMPTQVATTSENTYVDYLEENLSSSDRTFYFVRANESSQGIDNKIQTANSTYGYILHETKIFIPNAITPLEQDNNIFKPQCHFIQQGSYRMSIFNRYGTLIFFTDDLNQGWDGRYKGEFCKQGVYIYVIEFVNSLGEKQTRKGTVALIE